MTIQDVEQHADLAEARTFLAARAIAPDEAGEYTVAQIEQAIRDRGWRSSLLGKPDDWVASLDNNREDAGYIGVSAWSPDSAIALLRAFGAALFWLDDERVRQAFEEEAQSRLGMSGDEFRRAWAAGEFGDALWDGDHPKHLAIRRVEKLMRFG